MSSYISSFSPLMDSFFDLRKALGYPSGTHAASMRLFDRYYAAAYPEEIHLTEKIVLGWLEDRCTDIYEKSITMRLFAAIDKVQPAKAEPFIDEIAPVLYRMIYTCGLRPQEGRNLKNGEYRFQNWGNPHHPYQTWEKAHGSHVR